MDDEPTIEQLEQRLKNAEKSLDQYDESLNYVRRQLQQLEERRRELVILRDNAKLEQSLAAQELAILRDRAANEIPLEAIQSYLDALLLIPEHAKLFEFQRDDLVFMFGRHLYKDKYKGILNANDTGLGKTAETCVFLKTLQEMENNQHVAS